MKMHRVLRSLLCLLGFAAFASAQEPAQVLSEAEIADGVGGFDGDLDDGDYFGHGVACLGDVDGDGVKDLAVGTPKDDDGGVERGAVWVLFLNADGSVRDKTKISSTTGFNGGVGNADIFGQSVAPLGDLDSDGVPDLAVGAPYDDDGGLSSGSVWILFLNTDGTVKSHQKISNTAGNFSDTIPASAWFGWSLAAVGDLDEDGVVDLVTGAPNVADVHSGAGAVWVLFLNTDGTVKGNQKISGNSGSFFGQLDRDDRFGASVGALGDLNRDDVLDIAVGAYRDDDGGTDRGAIWVLFLNTDGTVSAHQKISHTQGTFDQQGGTLDDSDRFGASIAGVGDVNADGVPDVVVGAPLDADGGTGRGAVWTLFLRINGTVQGLQKVSSTEGSFDGSLQNSDWFGWSVADMGDFDGDGRADVAVGAIGDDGNGNFARGAVWMLLLDGLVPASTTWRNGSGTNVSCFSTTSSPVIGGTWTTEIATDHHAGASMTVLLIYDQPLEGVLTPYGELLIANEVYGGNFVTFSLAPAGGGVGLHSIDMPTEGSAAGYTAYSQAVILGGAPPELCNAIDVVVGY